MNKTLGKEDKNIESADFDYRKSYTFSTWGTFVTEFEIVQLLRV